MQGTSIKDQIGESVVNETVEQNIPVNNGNSGNNIGLGFDFLKAETGEGHVNEYLEHPLNFNNSKGMARVLRGLTGMFGALNYAVVDVLIGGLDVLKTSKKGLNNNDTSGVKGVS